MLTLLSGLAIADPLPLDDFGAPERIELPASVEYHGMFKVVGERFTFKGEKTNWIYTPEYGLKKLKMPESFKFMGFAANGDVVGRNKDDKDDVRSWDGKGRKGSSGLADLAVRGFCGEAITQLLPRKGTCILLNETTALVYEKERAQLFRIEDELLRIGPVLKVDGWYQYSGAGVFKPDDDKVLFWRAADLVVFDVEPLYEPVVETPEPELIDGKPPPIKEIAPPVPANPEGR